MFQAAQRTTSKRAKFGTATPEWVVFAVQDEDDTTLRIGSCAVGRLNEELDDLADAGVRSFRRRNWTSTAGGVWL